MLCVVTLSADRPPLTSSSALWARPEAAPTVNANGNASRQSFFMARNVTDRGRRAANFLGGRSAARELGGERGGLVGQCRSKHEVAIAQRLLRLLHEALGLIVLGAGVGVLLPVVHARQIAGGARQRLARFPFRRGFGGR